MQFSKEYERKCYIIIFMYGQGFSLKLNFDYFQRYSTSKLKFF